MDVYKSPVGQPKLKFGAIPFEFTPDLSNRWVRLADLIPWEELELPSGYRNHFGSTDNPALSFRVAFGALLVQTRLRLTDEETVEQIRENPYIQYFLGFEGYRSEKKPFDRSMMVYFRKRLDAETLKALDLRIFERRRELEEGAKKAEETGKKEDGDSSVPELESAPVDGSEEETPPPSPTSPIPPTSSFSPPRESPRRSSSTRSGNCSGSRARRSPAPTGAPPRGTLPLPVNRETSAGRSSASHSRSSSPTLRET